MTANAPKHVAVLLNRHRLKRFCQRCVHTAGSVSIVVIYAYFAQIYDLLFNIPDASAFLQSAERIARIWHEQGTVLYLCGGYYFV